MPSRQLRYTALLTIALAACTLHAPAQDITPQLLQTQWLLDAQDESRQLPLLNAYDSYFEQTTDFNFSFLRYQYRGYGNRYDSYRLGGTLFEEWFQGRPAWNAVNGLYAVGTDMYRTGEEVPNPFGQTENRAIHPWEQTRGGRVALSTSNRTYVGRGSIGYNSAENEQNGWGYSLYGSRSWGRSYVIDGLWNDSWTAFGSVSKRFGGDRHRLALTAWYAPTQRALQSASTAEAFALTGNNLYNPAWGSWQGRQRSSNVRTARQPVVMLTHRYSNEETFTLTTTVAARFGDESRSTLDWQNAPNPRPDYYRNMPSFQPEGSEMRAWVEELWRTDPTVQQIDWAAMVERNRNDSPRAHYVVASRVRDYQEWMFHSTARWQPDASTLLSAGVEMLAAENLHYKRLEDLLGADYWLDVDVFVENPEDVQNNTQNDMHHPNRQVHEGEDYDYKYSMQALRPRLWGRFTKQLAQWEIEAGGSLGLTAYRRFGYYDKENFSGSASFGWSSWLTRPEWSLEGGVGYRLGSGLRLGGRFAAQSLAPTPQNAFISPEYRNAYVPGLKNEQLLGVELSATYRSPRVRASLAAYATSIRNRTETRAFYDDLNHFYCNYLMSGIHTRHLGVEFSAEVQLGSQVWLRVAGLVSESRYASNPTATEIQESTGESVGTETVYYKSLHTATGPQTLGTLEIEYTPNNWTLSLAVNGFAGNYVAPTPLRRTERAFEVVDYAIAFDQENFGAGATLDLFCGKTFYLPGDQRLGIYAGINNLLNRRNIRTGGYESSRLRQNAAGDYLPLDSKYYYAQGINFFVTASWRF